jgi:hypothetical protein
MSITIYNDMDGVYVDMDLFIRECLSERAQNDDVQMWKELSKIENVYRKMPATPYARKLWAAVKATGLNCEMLTAIPRITSVPTAEADKRWWVQSRKDIVFDGDSPIVKIGPYSRDKWRHCMLGDVLIDDRADNCEAWKQAGGFAILHVGDADKTIAKLNKYVATLK